MCTVHSQPAVATHNRVDTACMDGHLKQVSVGQWVLAPILFHCDELVNWDRAVGMYYVKMQLMLHLCF